MQQSGKKPVNCIPCAKRKVRCDKRQPCGHCKRRSGDTCIYQRTLSKESRPQDHTQRIEVLEAYVRRLGGDPQQIEQSRNGEGYPGAVNTAHDGSVPAASTISARTSAALGKPRRNDKKRGLMATDEQLTYIETPIWNTWSGIDKQRDDTLDGPMQRASASMPKVKTKRCFSLLLDPMVPPDMNALHAKYPSSTNMMTLWKHYLTNVHPLVMIFFDWETDLIIRKASHDYRTLTLGEQSLVFAIFFITTLSLSEVECTNVLQDEKSLALDNLQQAVEDALMIAELVMTNDRLVLQAFMLYLLTMRHRARPAAVFTLQGIAIRIAERMGLHHDGDMVGIPVLRSEERRRMWWQLQHMDISLAQLVGTLTMTIDADWDTKPPSNLEDGDLSANLQALPPSRRGLTSMSICLWRYEILNKQRLARKQQGEDLPNLMWMLSPHVPLADKVAFIDNVEKALGEQFLQHCEPLEPQHVYIQIGVRSFIAAAHKLIRQPALVNAKISEMSSREREDMLAICTKWFEYYILGETAESLRCFRWYSGNFFQWASFVYIILEAHSRFDSDAVEELWSLITKVYAVHPNLMTATHRSDITAVARITLAAWQKRHTHLLQQSRRDGMEDLSTADSPPWIQELRRNFNIQDTSATIMTDQTPAVDDDLFLPLDFDFDSIDWSFWEDPKHQDATLYEF